MGAAAAIKSVVHSNADIPRHYHGARLLRKYDVPEKRRLTVLLNQGGRDKWVVIDNAVDRLVSPIALGDLDGDGRPDVVVNLADMNSGAVGVLRNQGGGMFALCKTLPVKGGGAITLGDFDGDKRLDIAARDWFSTDMGNFAVAVFLNRTP